MAAERLQKAMAAAGVASRRMCEELIAQGRVSVDGMRVTIPGFKVDAERQEIRVDGRLLPATSEIARRYLAVHKPLDYVTTLHDPQGRPSVLDLIDPALRGARIYPVGRLDYDSAGLLLLTNDGELTFRLTHPRYGVEKEYLVALATEPSFPLLEQLSRGIVLDGYSTAPARFIREEDWGGMPAVRVVLHEGRNRQIRRMFAWSDIDVIYLVRTRVGPISLGSLPEGASRELRSHEVAALDRAVGLDLA